MTYTGREPNPQGRVVAAYKYHAENGAYLGTKLRHENKAFRWIKERDGQQLPLDKEKREALPLYRADELAASDPLQTVWFCEGEKDADRLRSLELLATSVPHGALANGKEWKDRWVRSLRKHDQVFILEDNDEPGRQHATTVAAALIVMIPDVRVVRLPGLAEGGDVSDWLDAGHTLGELVEVAEATPRWTPPAWPTPRPLRTVPEDLADFPTPLLPAPLGAFVEEAAEELQTKRSVVALIALSTASASVARKVAVHVGGNWTEPLNLYTLTALGPGNRKTPAFKLALAPMERWERERADGMREEIALAKQRLAVLQKRRDEANRLVTKAESEVDRRNAESVAEKLALEVTEAERVMPRAQKLIAKDVTEEAVGRLLMQNEGRIFIASDEAAPIRNMAGRYDKNGTAVFEIFKDAHSASTIRVNRLGREEVHVPDGAITLALMVQPAVLDDIRTNAQFRGEGLLARFIYAVPESTVGRRKVSPEVIKGDVITAYHNLIRGLLNLPFGADERGAPAPHVMALSAGARGALTAFMTELEPRIGPDGDLGHVADWGGKLAGCAVRIAGILTLTARASIGLAEPWVDSVPLEEMNRAIAIVSEFIIPHGVSALGGLGADPVADLAEHAVRIIQREGWERFKHNQLFNKMRAPLGDNTKNLAPVLELLEEAGYVRSIGRKTATGGAPTGTYYDVNPEVHSRGAAS